jgi:hypothetical protein
MPGILASQSDAVPVGRRNYPGRGKGILSRRVQLTFMAGRRSAVRCSRRCPSKH